MVPRHQNSRATRRPNIWFLAHSSVVTNIIHSSEQAIIADCSWQTFHFRVAVVHGANDQMIRRNLWAELISYSHGNTVFIGDFNAVKGAHERISTVRPSRSACRDFCDFIDATNFIESPTSGLQFTWSGRRLLPRHVESRLDRALFSASFADIWNDIVTHALPRLTSDHSHLIFKCNSTDNASRRPFKFLNMWVSHPSFLDMVSASWSAAVETRCPIYRGMVKLRRLRGDIRLWNRTTFGNVDRQIQEDMIQQHIIAYFSTLFNHDGNPTVDRVLLEAIIDDCITTEQNNSLVCIPNDDEITAAVFGMDSNSAPGPDDLRPIILSNFFFKIISKILATRLSLVAKTTVSGNQFGFIGDRSIYDCIALGSEGFNCMNRTGRKSNMACKIDISKAFDTMSWSFIIQVLRVNGYHEKFITWISIIFQSARISIFYNGKLSGYFACSRGVRQGDPLSPIIFGIAEDVLSHLFINCVNSRHLVPMDFSRGAHFPTHLFYADDILIFCKASCKNARKIKEILDLYGEISGQICNTSKSNIFFSNGVTSNMRVGIKRELGFSLGTLPVNYLGVPLFTGRIRASYLAAIHDKIVNKFSRWKGMHLSMAGCICLVRSVIQSSVTHSMMIYRWPKSLIHNLDKCCRNFIWSGSVDTKPSCSVNWSRVCAPRVEGGLGVRSFSAMNSSFLMKMAWRIIQGQDYGPSILKTRYLTNFGYAKPYLASSPFWTSIRQHVDDLVDNSYAYIGTGRNTYFWKDDWLGYKLLDRLRIPPFMHNFLNQAVEDYYYDGIWHFTEAFVINYPDVVVDILLLPIGDERDARLWKSSVHGNVTAALAYDRQGPHFPEVRWGRWIWEKFIPERRSLICWCIIHKRLPTFDGLMRRGMMGPNRCAVCGMAEESINHLFWECNSIQPIWREFANWFNKDYSHYMDIHCVLVAAWNENFSSQIVTGFLKVMFKEMDLNFSKLGNTNNSWSDYLVMRSIGVTTRAAPPPTMIEVHWWPAVDYWGPSHLGELDLWLEGAGLFVWLLLSLFAWLVARRGLSSLHGLGSRLWLNALSLAVAVADWSSLRNGSLVRELLFEVW
ncbi:uncharacterized protein LOC131023288 [Salvia miltiorrhiza]|uniref:uncharacterized protein LOC131023288 n=1 Tax=Salvia miltiorrhiza TaxID=226208 RepID=UPI0025AD01AC|nr:uncharacterized protein LOC131023288 [Salvia miltiorrhiza]